MPERDGYIAGVPCWIDTTQPDPDAAASFYTGLFGWEVENVMPADEAAKYLIARIRGGDVAAISSQWEGAPPEAVWNTYIWVDDADESAAKAREAGGSIVGEPMDVGEAGRMAVLADPEGAVFSVWQAREHKGARVVNEHGSVELQHPEDGRSGDRKALLRRCLRLDDTRSRQRSVLGHERLGDYLEDLTPGTRAQAAEFGAAGFEDVVAAIAPLAGGGTRVLRGTSRSEPRTPTRRRRRPRSSVARWSFLRSMRRTRDSRCCVTRRERRLPPRRSCPRTRTSGAPPESNV